MRHQAWLFRDHGAGRAGLRLDLDDAECLVTTLVVFKRESAAVLPPHQIRHVEGIGKEARVDGDLTPAANIEQHRLLEIQLIAGLGVLDRPVLGLQLILRRRGDVMHQPAKARANAIGGHLGRVGRPDDGRAVVVVAFGAVRAEGDPLVTADGPDGDVVVIDERHPLAVRRQAGTRRHGREIAAHGSRDAAANVARSRQLGCPAGIVGQHARPAGAVDRQIDGAQRLVEGEALKGQPAGHVGAIRGLRQCVREARVVERRLLLADVGVHRDELIAVGTQTPVVEAVRGANPRRRVWHVDSERLERG